MRSDRQKAERTEEPETGRLRGRKTGRQRHIN